MRKLFVATAVLCCFGVKAQQKPHYTQYVLNNYILNPAVAGIENYWDAKISHRRQWVGLEGAPVTTYVTIHGPLSKNDYGRENPTTVHAPGENPRGQAYWQDYTSGKGHHGIGFTFLSDKVGPLTNTSFGATYAYHLPVAPKTTLSMGATLGLQSTMLDQSKLNFGSGSPFPGYDPSVANSGMLRKWNPDISAGLWLYSSDFFVGVSAQQLYPGALDFSDPNAVKPNESGKLIPHVFGTAGFRVFASDDISILPSIMMRYAAPLPVGFDVNAKVLYRDFIWAGGSYRVNDGFAAMVGVSVNSTINIGYSYDIVTSKLNTVTKGSHEFLIGFLLGNQYGDLCPRNLW